MSSQWKDPTGIWQISGETSWDNPDDAHESPPLSTEADRGTIGSNAPGSTGKEFDTDRLDEPAPTKFELLKQLGQQFSHLLIPLFIGGIILLVMLSFALRNQSYLSSSDIWPFVFVFIAVAIVHGTLLYFGDSNRVFWLPSLIGGISLYLLIASYTLLGPGATVIVAAGLLVLFALLAGRCFRSVSEGHAALVHSFGKYSRTFFPGFNILLPWEQMDRQIDTREKHWTCPQQRVRISRDEDVLVKATIWYQLTPEDAHIAELQVDNWQRKLQEMFIATVQTVANKFTPEDFIAWEQKLRTPQLVSTESNDLTEDTTGWDRINMALKRQMEDQVAEWGVQIRRALIHDVALTSHLSTAADPAGAQAGDPTVIINASTGTASPQGQTQGATPQTIATPTKVPKEDVLIKLYEDVRIGRIKEPTTIRTIAAGFLAIAKDPAANKVARSDPARAAEILLKQAQMLEEQAKKEANTADKLQTGWPNRRATSTNLKSGG